MDSKWTITASKVEGKGKIPKDAFGDHADLLILNKDSDTRPVVWVNARSELCWVDNLPKDGNVAVPVHFGSTEVPCYVSITVTPGGRLMNGTLREAVDDGTDGNAGTFAADASAPPPPGGPPGKP